MAIERPRIPPERKPVSEYPTPSPNVVIYSELVNRTDPAYVQNAPVPRGTLYSSMVNANRDVIAAYPNLYFLKERRFGQSDQLVLWDWATVPDAEDTYNAEVNYVCDSVLHPAFSRVYTLRRDDYDATPYLAEGSTLTGLIGVKIIDGGQNYTYATGTINNTDVDIEFVIQDGVIVSGVVRNEGTGILSTSTIIITGDGAAAVAVPIVQGTTCYLVNQKKQEFPEDHQLRNEFVRVVRVYETLPGVYITTSRVDEDGKTITVQRRHQLQSVIDAIDPRETVVGGVWTRITSEPVNESYFVGWEVRESRVLPGNAIPSTRFRSDGSVVNVTKTLGLSTSIVPGGAYSGGFLILTRKEEVSDLVSWQVQETSEVPGPDVHGEHIDETYGLIVDITKTIVKDNVFITPNPAVDGTYYEYKPVNEWQSVQIASKFNLDSLPEDVTWYGGQFHSFPAVLVTGAWNPISNPYGVVIQWAEATCGCSDSFSAVLQANFNHYAGEVKARYTEQFYFGVPPDDVTIYQFFPQAHTFGFAWSSFCGDNDGNCRTKSGAPQFRISACLHDDFHVCVCNLITYPDCSGCPGNSWSFSATSPADLPHGDYIMLPPHIERWRFGVYRRVLVEILVP